MFRSDFKIRISLSSVQMFLLAAAPILHIYRFVSIITWGEVALCLAALLSLAKGAYYVRKPYIVNTVLVIIGYFAISTLLGTLLWQGPLFDVFKEYLVFVIYYVIALILMQRTELTAFISVYKKVAMITACLVIIQYVANIAFGIQISGLIPNVTTYFGNSTNVYIGKITNRCAGFFTEPAMCARYMAIPFLLHIADLIKKSKKLIDSFTIILTAALLFTLSGNAIAALLIGYGFYMLSNLRKRSIKSILRFVVLVAAFVAAVILLYRQPVFQRLFNRIEEIGGDSTFKSGYIRITRGFVIYANLPFPGPILGIGFGNYKTVVDTYLWDLMVSLTDKLPYWINGIQEYFIYGGIIGVMLFGSLLLFCWKRGDQQQKLVLTLFVAYLAIAGIASTPLWVIFMVIIGSQKIKPKEKGGEKSDFCSYTNTQQSRSFT